MILKLNHPNAKATATTQDLIESIYGLVADGQIDMGQFARLQIELDWIQYKHNFRERVAATYGNSRFDEPAPVMDVHVDARQVVPECLRSDLLTALKASPDGNRVPLEEFCSLRTS